jgi:hypothetical protein
MFTTDNNNEIHRLPDNNLGHRLPRCHCVYHQEQNKILDESSSMPIHTILSYGMEEPKCRNRLEERETITN